MKSRTGYTVAFFTEHSTGEKLFRDLDNNGFRVIKISEYDDANKLITENNPQLIILDIKTNDFAIKTLNILAVIKEVTFVPKIVISSISDVKSKVEILKSGVWDYITSPFEFDEFLARINCHLLNSIYISKLVQENIKLKNSCIIDNLTGLYTRKYLTNRLVEEVSRAVRKGESLSFAIIQTDRFEEIVDSYGQGAIEHIIKQVSIIIKQLVRLSDIVVRYSEKEIAVLCPITDRSGMDIFIDRLNNKINDSIFEYNAEIIKFSVNIGAYTLESSDFNTFENKITNIITFAEEALERAINNEESNIEYYE